MRKSFLEAQGIIPSANGGFTASIGSGPVGEEKAGGAPCPLFCLPQNFLVLRPDGEGVGAASLFSSHLAAGVPFWGAGKYCVQPASWMNRQGDGWEAPVTQRR